MKLLKFVNGDAPQTFTAMKFDGKELSFPGLAKTWTAVNQSPVSGCYWLLDDNGKPVCQLNDVVVMKGAVTSAAAPTPIRDDHVAGVDIRSKLGKMLESSRAEYGSTFKTAASSAAVQMNAEAEREKRQEKMRKQRSEVAQTVEKGEEPVLKKSRKEETVDEKAKNKSKKGHH